MTMPVAARILGLALIVGTSMRLQAQTVLDVIDIRPIVARYPGGNVLGLAFDPDANVLYLAYGPFIYTLDLAGNLLYELNLPSVQPNTAPHYLSYDKSSGNLFVGAIFYPPAEPEEGDPFETRVLVIDPQMFSVLANIPIDNGGDGIHVSDDGIWQARFAEDVIRHYTRSGVFIENVSVASSFPGFPGPSDLAASFSGGFFVLDHFESGVVEIDLDGRELAASSTASLADGRPSAIDSDVDGKRIFLQINNEEIVVLSSDFIGATSKPIAIDIKPGGFPNSINPRSKGKIAVGILTTQNADDFGTFDATTVDPLTVRFGTTGDEAAPVGYGFEDVDGDGNADMLLHFNTAETSIRCGETSASLTGETYGAQSVRGTDSIRTVGCR